MFFKILACGRYFVKPRRFSAAEYYGVRVYLICWSEDLQAKWVRSPRSTAPPPCPHFESLSHTQEFNMHANIILSLLTLAIIGNQGRCLQVLWVLGFVMASNSVQGYMDCGIVALVLLAFINTLGKIVSIINVPYYVF